LLAAEQELRRAVAEAAVEPHCRNMNDHFVRGWAAEDLRPLCILAVATRDARKPAMALRTLGACLALQTGSTLRPDRAYDGWTRR
jgi:hypothetical protein